MYSASHPRPVDAVRVHPRGRARALAWELFDYGNRMSYKIM